MTGLSSVYGLVGVNSRRWVQSNRKFKSHESCIVGLSECGCQKKSVVYETGVDMYQFREVSRIRTIYSTKADARDIIFNTF